MHRCYSYEPTPRAGDQPPIQPSDRAALRANILSLIAGSSSRPVTLQLAHILRNITSYDYPERYPGLLADIKALLSSNDIRQVHAGCVAVLEAVRGFRYVYINSFLFLSGALRLTRRNPPSPP